MMKLFMSLSCCSRLLKNYTVLVTAYLYLVNTKDRIGKSTISPETIDSHTIILFIFIFYPYFLPLDSLKQKFSYEKNQPPLAYPTKGDFFYLFLLLHRNTLCQISWFIHITASLQRSIISKQL